MTMLQTIGVIFLGGSGLAILFFLAVRAWFNSCDQALDDDFCHKLQNDTDS